MVSKPLIIALVCVAAAAAGDMLWKEAPARSAVASSADIELASSDDAGRASVEKQPAPIYSNMDNPLSHTSAKEFDVISKHVLFNPSRTQPVEVLLPVLEPVVQQVVLAAPVQLAPDPNEFTLLGIMTANRSRIALLRWNKTQATLRLKSGDSYEGWQVAEISDREISIGQGGKLFSLKLFKSPGELKATAAQD